MTLAFAQFLRTGQMMAAYSSSELIGIYQKLEQFCPMHLSRKQQSYDLPLL
jgi:hypothetical protein